MMSPFQVRQEPLRQPVGANEVSKAELEPLCFVRGVVKKPGYFTVRMTVSVYPPPPPAFYEIFLVFF